MGAGDFLRKAFPFLSVAATTFGGPVGAIAAQAIGAAIGKEVKPEAVQDQINKLSLTEEGRLKLEAAENDFKLTMEKLGYEHIEQLEQLAASDRDSARKREIAVKDKMPMILASTVLAGYFTVQIMLFTRVVDANMRELVLRSLGTMDMALGLVLSYYFGSSAGSRLKDEAIAKASKKD